MSTFVVHIHFSRLVVIQFFPNVGLVFGGESGPGFVSPAVVLMTWGHFYVVVELNNLKINVEIVE